MNDDQLTLIKDSREPETAWDAYFQSQCEVQALKTGDYSVKGYEDLISIERKTLDDLLGCLTSGRERFERELQRARELEFFCVICESSWPALVAGQYRSKMNPNSATESISAFEIRYGRPFYFCGNQEMAARKCESLLRKFHRERQKALITADYEFPF